MGLLAKHPSCNYHGGSPLCLWRKPPEGASNTGGVEVRLGHKGVQSPLGLCSQQSRKASSVLGGPVMKEHSTVLFWQYVHVSLRNTSILTGGCPHRQVGGDELFWGQSGSFTMGHCWPTERPQNHDHRLLITYDLICSFFLDVPYFLY